MIAQLMSVAMVVTSAVIMVAAWLNWRRVHWWVYLAFSATWLGWLILYTFVLIADPVNYDNAWFGRTFVRPLNLWSSFLVASVMIYRLRQHLNGHR